MRIESIQNPKIKHVLRLQQDNRFRKREQLFVVEGQQECTRALQFGLHPAAFYIEPDIINGFTLPETDCPVYEVTAAVYEKIAYRKGVEGVVGIFETPQQDLASLKLGEEDKVIIVEGIEKPGNLGAILRSCEAFGIAAVILANSKIDLYHPNVIRSSVGCLFGMQVYHATPEETIDFLKAQKCPLYITNLHHDAKLLPHISFRGRAAVAFGTEHSGLTTFWLDKGENIIIPMRGTIDSLNLSNAVAITCYAMMQS